MYIDRDEGVNLDDCEAISRELGEYLDAEDFIADNYFLEVSSPGIERALKTDRHYAAAVGEEVRLKLYKAQDGAKEIEGVLSDFDSESVTLSVNDEKVSIQRKKYCKGNIVLTFNGSDFEKNERRFFVTLLEQFEEGKGISRDVLIEALEQALVSAYKRNYGSHKNVRVEIDRQNGSMNVYVKRGCGRGCYSGQRDFFGKRKENQSQYELGDVIEEKQRRRHSGIAAQTARQVVTAYQKPRETWFIRVFRQSRRYCFRRCTAC